jgi:OHCU decarboxylase
MFDPLTRLNSLSAADAEAEFERCCGSRDWARRMTGARPFSTRAELRDIAERVWWALGPDAWLQAFAAHPKIGERPDGAGWSAQEQAAMHTTAADTRVELAAVNVEYERRFGYIFIINATGKSGDEMLATAKRRLLNDPDTELRIAAREQAAITRLRLEKLLAS